MATILIAHGAWSAAWAWKKMRPLLQARGHDVHIPTYTGLGERAHLASREVGLGTHIADVLGTLEYEDLRDVMLVGHSYGGMVATGVADRARARVRRLVYLDAFVPRDGQSLLYLLPTDMRERMRESARAAGEGWRVPPNPVPPDTSEADVAWLMPRRVMQPLRAFEEPLRLTAPESGIPRVYIYCTRVAPGDVFGQFAQRAQREPGWQYVEIGSSHSPNVTAPEELATLLDKLAS
jgi:pimeloyl-ACP methyl ester carboxylesterase